MAKNHFGTSLSSAATSTLNISLTNDAGFALLADCVGTPPTTASLFAHGCIINQTDSGAGNPAIYENTGTTASPVWDLIGSVSPGAIALAEGRALIGSAANLAAVSTAIVVDTGALGVINWAAGANGNITVDPAGSGRLIVNNGADVLGDSSFETQKDGAVGLILELINGSATPAAQDAVGELQFIGTDSGLASTVYARIAGSIGSPTAGSERGATVFQSTVNGSLVTDGIISHDGTNATWSVGDGSGNGVVQSLSNFDLVLRTGNATTGSITIADGANGAINITPNGSGVTSVGSSSGTASLEGFVAINGPMSLNDTPITVAASGALSVNKSTFDIDTTSGALALTLADATVGRLVFLRMVTDGGADAVLTPANLLGAATTITFDDVGDTALLFFSTGGWAFMGGTATLA